ncbi:NAD(P)/FAD-dependent oxidoreductase [Aneurinibacillus migulanus]|jgi:sulfide:quinone oxidoreductase|uniref:Pyridine nucleotide-disulfide oxidoreductase n=1 Tax=Aneurinibacillus migulanus TaxID=47500 RepID=A0A0D1VUR2_ANEMI|nr:FAD/NAD(P)-binding oxidoreductase [Aneurinibacillus migulanus]KIV50005.1 pyridine nucleotide-disulfide oxidoreductase [Aneurinibacillus migulanus]KON97804.1 pyridine nucleotide-disulfide oxidoreductase [Aneurinibacillus migulanus]MCP1358528.1 NAD(P)/FAD-dependent oxidoreductase [Aneurinibacillus migulanus]MED0895064.1 FAD/NAD(P)-binding oxidoreductase [Aneurinibacillus migulanus]MED1619403.1 FAD/NAD(P)-binding oxidoreductase [Aneurinibacillus migulanus]
MKKPGHETRYKVVIVGGGSAGITVAARLLRERRALRESVAIIDPATKHYYQPLWTLVGAGEANRESTEREEASVIPDGAVWLQDTITEFQPDENAVITDSGYKLYYDYLIIAAGIQIDWNKIKGLKESIGKDGVCSNYSYDYVESTWESIQSFKGGSALFTNPNTPVKCGGAPQKIMYLADDYFRKSGVRSRSEVTFISGGATIFNVEKYAHALRKVIERKQIKTQFNHNLIEINSRNKQAIFENVNTRERVIMQYDMIHVVPPMSAPDFIKMSPLAAESGWLEVDQYTLQHKRFHNVFGIGDCTNLPTSKTGAAIRKQAPVLVKNLLCLMRAKPVVHTYDGYTSCPLVTGYGKLILAEFDYGLNPQESFPIDQSRERFSMYVLKKNLLPIMYWNGMLKGLM